MKLAKKTITDLDPDMFEMAAFGIELNQSRALRASAFERAQKLKDAGWSQAALAQAAGVTQQQMSSWLQQAGPDTARYRQQQAEGSAA